MKELNKKAKAIQKENDDWVDEPTPKVKQEKPKMKATGLAKANKALQTRTRVLSKKTKKVLRDLHKSYRPKTKKVFKEKSDSKITLNFKVVPTEAKKIKAKADKLTNGNVTQMIRLALLSWQPSKKSLTDIRKTTRA